MTDSVKTTLASSDKLIRRIAFLAEKHSYYHFVSGWIPDHKEPKTTDRKLIAQYDIPHSRIGLIRDSKKDAQNCDSTASSISSFSSPPMENIGSSERKTLPTFGKLRFDTTDTLSSFLMGTFEFGGTETPIENFTAGS